MNERKILLILTALFILFAAATLITISRAEDDGYYVICKPGGEVNVRSRPDMSAPVVGWVSFGRYVHTDGKEKNGFVHVVDLAAETTSGWVYAGFLVYDRPREEQYTAEVWGGPVIARNCVGGKRIRRLKDGATVTVYARSNAWAVTSAGYIMCDWLREVE